SGDTSGPDQGGTPNNSTVQGPGTSEGRSGAGTRRTSGRDARNGTMQTSLTDLGPGRRARSFSAGVKHFASHHSSPRNESSRMRGRGHGERESHLNRAHVQGKGSFARGMKAWKRDRTNGGGKARGSERRRERGELLSGQRVHQARGGTF